MIMERITTYKAGHTYKETFTPTDLFCPNCGNRGVYEGSQYDYYCGADHECLICHHHFTIQGPSPQSEDDKVEWAICGQEPSST